MSGDERSPPRRVSPPPLFGRCTKCPPRSLFPLVCSLGLALAAPENTTAVEVTAFFGKVSIDLNGFTIQGVTICGAGPTNPAVCDPLGSGEGISAGSNTRVHNGIVAHMGSDGIHRGSGRVEDVVVFMNGGGWCARLGRGVRTCRHSHVEPPERDLIELAGWIRDGLTVHRGLTRRFTTPNMGG